MTLADWLRTTRQNFAEDSWMGIRESAYELWIGGLRRLDAFAPSGENVFKREWDLLLILDGCRVDAIEAVADEYDFLDRPGVHRSTGSTSHQWMERTFVPAYTDEMVRTGHVSANPYTDTYCDGDAFAVFEEVWRDSWSDRAGVVPARPVTDRAIRVSREHGEELDRLLVHYMQPHFPSVPEPLGYGTDLESWRAGREMPWQGIRRGELAVSEVWEAYIANLRYVLDDVALLLENLDADRVVISADHGNAKGEWGVYGHPDVPISVLRKVPWYVTDATDERTYEPDPEAGGVEDEEKSVEDRLRALGYREP